MTIATSIGTTAQTTLSRLGTDVEALTWREAQIQSGLDWTVSKIQHSHALTGEPIESFGIYRDDNGAFLGQVGNQFTPVQNTNAFQFVDDILSHVPDAKFKNAGSVDGGKMVFCSARIGGFEVTGGDVHDAMLTFSDGKDGKTGCKAQISIYRQVCSNGLHRWINDAALSFRRTKNVEARLKNAAHFVRNIQSDLTGIREKFEILASRKIDSGVTVQTILDRMFPETAGEKAGRNNYTRQEKQALIASLFESNDNGAFPEQDKTAFAMFNAVTNYVDHHASYKVTANRSGMVGAELQASQAMFGSGNALKNTALDIILEETANARTVKPVKFYQAGSSDDAILLASILDDGE